MIIKLSYRDTGARDIARSLYFSALSNRAISDAAQMFPAYSNADSPDHKQAVDFVLEQLEPMVVFTAKGHEVNREELVSSLRTMVSEGLS